MKTSRGRRGNSCHAPELRGPEDRCLLRSSRDVQDGRRPGTTSGRGTGCLVCEVGASANSGQVVVGAQRQGRGRPKRRARDGERRGDPPALLSSCPVFLRDDTQPGQVMSSDVFQISLTLRNFFKI